MKFHRSSFIFATLASSSSFKALAAPTDRNQQHDVAARQIPDAPGVVPPAAPPVPGVVSSSLSAISGGMQPPSIPSVPGTGSTSGGNPSTREFALFAGLQYSPADVEHRKQHDAIRPYTPDSWTVWLQLSRAFLLRWVLGPF